MAERTLVSETPLGFIFAETGNGDAPVVHTVLGYRSWATREDIEKNLHDAFAIINETKIRVLNVCLNESVAEPKVMQGCLPIVRAHAASNPDGELHVRLHTDGCQIHLDFLQNEGCKNAVTTLSLAGTEAHGGINFYQFERLAALRIYAIRNKYPFLQRISTGNLPRTLTEISMLIDDIQQIQGLLNLVKKHKQIKTLNVSAASPYLFTCALLELVKENSIHHLQIIYLENQLLGKLNSDALLEWAVLNISPEIKTLKFGIPLATREEAQQLGRALTDATSRNKAFLALDQFVVGVPTVCSHDISDGVILPHEDLYDVCNNFAASKRIRREFNGITPALLPKAMIVIQNHPHLSNPSTLPRTMLYRYLQNNAGPLQLDSTPIDSTTKAAASAKPKYGSFTAKSPRIVLSEDEEDPFWKFVWKQAQEAGFDDAWEFLSQKIREKASDPNVWKKGVDTPGAEVLESETGYKAKKRTRE